MDKIIIFLRFCLIKKRKNNQIICSLIYEDPIETLEISEVHLQEFGQEIKKSKNSQ